MPAVTQQAASRGAARGSLLGIEGLSVAEITKLLQLARKMNPRPLLRGKKVLLLFYEASTRTRASFEIAAKALGATTTLVLSSGSSIEKGESLLDTAYTLRAAGTLAGTRDNAGSGAAHQSKLRRCRARGGCSDGAEGAAGAAGRSKGESAGLHFSVSADYAAAAHGEK